MLDLALLKLQYEILNVPLEQIDAAAGLPIGALAHEAKRLGWKQLWPDQPSLATPTSSYLQPQNQDEANEALALESEQYIDNARKRLKVYTLAKEILLAQRYLELECGIIQCAKNILENAEASPESMPASAIKQMSAMLKDLQHGSNLANLASMSISQDENGLPQVIIRDLSGQK